MNSLVEEEWLIIVLAAELSLALVPKDEAGHFRVAGVEFRSPDDNFLTAFYDRLVDGADRLVGIRVNPTTGVAAELLGSVPPRSYLQVGEGYVDIFLGGGAVPGAESTGDQAFGGQVFSSSAGDVALSLDVNFLCASGADYSAIRSAKARWIDVEMD